MLGQRLGDGGLKRRLAPQGLPAAHDSRHPRVGCAGEGIGLVVAGDDQHDLPGGEGAALLGVQQSLQVGAAAGD